MAEKTLYTALGHFRCRNDGGGRRYPVILMDHREFGMDPQEMTLWTALCWRLTDRQRAEDFYEQLSNGMELFPRRSFSDCIDRLVTRGLVAKGSGTTTVSVTVDDAAPMTCIVRCNFEDGAQSDGTYTLSNSDVTMGVKGETFQISLRDASGNKVTGLLWVSSDLSVCSVDGTGVVKAEGKGTAYISTTYNGVSYQCIVRCNLS